MIPPESLLLHGEHSFVMCIGDCTTCCQLSVHPFPSLSEPLSSSAEHSNVVYVGDRKTRGQLNGKSANLNHTIMNHIYPHTVSPDDIPEGDVLMVMDCDHMVKPDIFFKMSPCMLDPRVGCTLVPQARFPVQVLERCSLS